MNPNNRLPWLLASLFALVLIGLSFLVSEPKPGLVGAAGVAMRGLLMVWWGAVLFWSIQRRNGGTGT